MPFRKDPRAVSAMKLRPLLILSGGVATLLTGTAIPSRQPRLETSRESPPHADSPSAPLSSTETSTPPTSIQHPLTRSGRDELRGAVGKLKAQWKSLRNLPDDELILSVEEYLTSSSSTLLTTSSDYRWDTARLSSAIQAGFGPVPPKVQALHASTAEKRAELLKRARAFRANLEFQIQNAEEMLVTIQETGSAIR